MPTTKTFRNGPIILSLALGLALALWPTPALAQSDEFHLNFSRDFGYSNGAGQVRGNFTISITGQLSNIQEVTYLIDGKTISAVDTAPFKLSFVTSNYADGWHALDAQVLTKDGREVDTGTRQFEFVSAAQESAAVRTIALPLLGVLFLVIIVGIGVQVLFTRNRPKVNLPLGAARNYGINGGTICPKCHRPFAMHWWALNAGITSKIDRCDFCGRSGVFKRYSREALAAAEAAELQMAQPEKPLQPLSETQKLKEMLDESRYTDKS